MPANITAEDLLHLPDDGYKNELYEGELIREMAASIGHGALCHRLGGVLGIYARTTGFANNILQNSLFDLTPAGAAKKTVLAPDLAIMRHSDAPSWNQAPKETPLLAVEVVSASQTLAELTLKAQFYRNAGVDEVWIIDHSQRIIEVWTAAGQHTLTDAQTLTSELLPGFGVAVKFLLDG